MVKLYETDLKCFETYNKTVQIIYNYYHSKDYERRMDK